MTGIRASRLAMNDTIQMPYTNCTVMSIKQLGSTNHDEYVGILELTVRANNGPFKGLTGTLLVTEQEKIKLVKKYPRTKKLMEYLRDVFKISA